MTRFHLRARAVHALGEFLNATLLHEPAHIAEPRPRHPQATGANAPRDTLLVVEAVERATAPLIALLDQSNVTLSQLTREVNGLRARASICGEFEALCMEYGGAQPGMTNWLKHQLHELQVARVIAVHAEAYVGEGWLDWDGALGIAVKAWRAESETPQLNLKGASNSAPPPVTHGSAEHGSATEAVQGRTPAQGTDS